MKTRVDGECSYLALGAPVPIQMVRIRYILSVAIRAGCLRDSRVNHEVMSTLQTEMWRVIADAFIKPIMVRMVGILLGPGFIDVIGVAVRP